MYQCMVCGAKISPNAPICYNCGDVGQNAGGGGCVLLAAVLFVLFLAIIVAPLLK